MKTARLLAVGGRRPAAVDRFLTNRSGGPGPPRCPKLFIEAGGARRLLRRPRSRRPGEPTARLP